MKKSIWLILFAVSVAIGVIYLKYFKPTETSVVPVTTPGVATPPPGQADTTVTPDPASGSPLSGNIVPQQPSGLPQPLPQGQQVPLHTPGAVQNGFPETPSYEPPPPPPQVYTEPEPFNGNPPPYEPPPIDGDFVPPDVPPPPPPPPVGGDDDF